MKITAICGSPRKGNTYKALNSIKENYPNLDYKILMLKELDFNLCRGCYTCITRGEDKCPIKDDKDLIIKEMLDAIPFPNNSVDILMTSQAIGWNLKKELHEIERVLKPKGRAIHLFKDVKVDEAGEIHDILTSLEWKYEYDEFQSTTGWKLKYFKSMSE